MKKVLLYLFFSLLFLWPSKMLFSQEREAAGDFISPVDFRLALSGTFGELRTDHFHSGIDIKTWGVKGKAIRAVADGFVSRISVSGTGYGNALYVEHPNGYTSVYAHCRNFRDDIATWVKEEQYRQESFKVNVFPDAERFVVKQGDVIAFSGNSGNSFGPHLHFEIRETASQNPVNPLSMGMPVKDFIRPTFKKLMVYPYGKYSFVDRLSTVVEYQLAGWGPDCYIKNHDTILLSGKAYFGIEAFDVLNDSKNHNGIYAMEVYLDSLLKYSHAMDEFSFSESCDINSMIDYAFFSRTKHRIQKTYIEPNNQLSVYQAREGDGVMDFIDDHYHDVLVVIKDFHGNESLLRFVVKSEPPSFQKVIDAEAQQTAELVFQWDRPNFFEADGIRLSLMKGALYDSIHFDFSRSAGGDSLLSEVFHVHHRGSALKKKCKLEIRVEENQLKYPDKVLIVRIEDDEVVPSGGKLTDGWLQTSIDGFGDYAVMTDTLPPELKPLNIFPGKNLADQKTIKIRINDDLSGISHYRASMNGHWILMESDPKNDLLIYHIDEYTKSGSNTFKLELSDERDNKTTYEATLIR